MLSRVPDFIENCYEIVEIIPPLTQQKSPGITSGALNLGFGPFARITLAQCTTCTRSSPVVSRHAKLLTHILFSLERLDVVVTAFSRFISDEVVSVARLLAFYFGDETSVVG